MQNMFGVALSSLMAFSCASTGATGSTSSPKNHAAPSSQSLADACNHLQTLASQRDPWSTSNRSQCQSVLQHDISMWQPKVGEAVIQCILESTDAETVHETCRFSVIAKSLGLGFRDSDLSTTDACLSLRDKQARETPKKSFDGPACESQLKTNVERWQPAVAQALFQCIVSAPTHEQASDCYPSSLARELGLEHPDKSKTSEVFANLGVLRNGVVAYYAANSKLPPAVAATPSNDCCSQGGQCQPNASEWQIPGWAALSFKIETPHYYSYELAINDNGGSFTLIGVGDLDCDGVQSKFTLYGQVAEDGTLRTAGDIISQAKYE